MQNNKVINKVFNIQFLYTRKFIDTLLQCNFVFFSSAIFDRFSVWKRYRQDLDIYISYRYFTLVEVCINGKFINFVLQ